MANPTSVGVADTDNNPATIVTSGTAVSVTLSRTKRYSVQHSGIDSAAAAQVEVIMCAVSDGTPATSEGTKKFLLNVNSPVEIGPGVTTLTLKSTANVPLVSVCPVFNTSGRW